MCFEDECCDGSCCCCCCCKNDGSCEGTHVLLCAVCFMFAGWGVIFVGMALFIVYNSSTMMLSGIIIMSLGATMVVLSFITCCCVGCDDCGCCKCIGDCCSCCMMKLCCMEETSISRGPWIHSRPQRSGVWSHSYPGGNTRSQLNGVWSHSHPGGDSGGQLNGVWSHSHPPPNQESETNGRCCIHCICFDGGIGNGWDHRGTRWTEVSQPITTIEENRGWNDPTVIRLEEMNSNSPTRDGQTDNNTSTTSNVELQPTSPSVRISGDSDTRITNPREPPNPAEPPNTGEPSGEPPSYSSIMAATHMRRLRTPGLSPRSGATPFDPPPEYEEVVL